MPKPIVQQLGAALLVGRTERHNELADLLEKALFQQHPDSELKRLLSTMLSGGLFSSRYSRIFSLSPRNYGNHGGHPYFKPCGWLRYAIHHDNFDKTYSDWCVAYHGTIGKKATSILGLGLQAPGAPGVSIAHGQARSTTGRTIYLSPSIEYAAFPCYSEFLKLADQHCSTVHTHASLWPIRSH